MAKLISAVIVLIALGQTCLADDVTEGTELVLAFMVHRHGDRTPVRQTAQITHDFEKLKRLIEPYGYGQLTNIGIARSYELGHFIRQRYDDQLSPRYNLSEIHIRSTDSTRTKMTVLAAMAAVYPPNERGWSDKLNWTPTPYTTVPAKYDPNLAVVNCPVFVEAYYSAMLSPNDAMNEFSGLFEKLASLGYDVRKMPARVFAIYDSFVAQRSLGMTIQPEILELFPEIQAAAAKAIGIIFGDERYLDLQAGVLLKSFFDIVDAAISGCETKNIYILSAHDYNVFSLLSATQVSPSPGVPQYTSLYSLELRRVVESGEYVILPVYLRSAEAKVEYLSIKGCDNLLCNVEQFREVTSRFVINETAWRAKCEFNENMARYRPIQHRVNCSKNRFSLFHNDIIKKKTLKNVKY